MTDRKYSMKMEKQFKSKRTGTLLVAIVLLIGIVTVSIQYFNFVSQTVYHESVSHLTEIFHQSNSALNELVNKNLTYLHMWSEYLQNTSCAERDGVFKLLFSVSRGKLSNGGRGNRVSWITGKY